MSTITTRAGKGSPLTNTELDDNFSNLNADKIEDLSTFTTDNLTEGTTNQYYLDSRSRSSISLTTDNAASLSYNDTTGVFTYNDPTGGGPVAASTRVVVDVRNESGATISAGAAVYVSGSSGNNVLVDLADSNDPGKNPAIGIVLSSISHNSTGEIVTFGRIDYDTTNFSINEVLYLSETAGELTNIKPTSANSIVQNVGRVVKAGSLNGLITVVGAGRANDVPNLADGNVFIGGVSGNEQRDLVTADISDLTATATELNYADGVTSNIQTQLDSKLASSSYTASDILTKIKTVDGAVSGLDADLLDGQEGSYYTGYTDTAIANLVDLAPGTLDTLNELAAALGDDANFSTTVTNSIATKLPLAGGTMTGNIVMLGAETVDGRDLSVDGAKLDGIESGATADQTASEILTAIKTVDGSLSGLDADLLDGNHATAFATAAQGALADSALQPGAIGVTVQAYDPTIVVDADIGVTVQGYSAILAGTTASFTTADQTKLNGIESGATADQTASEILTAIKTVDGAGSGLDADLLDGQSSAYYQPASSALTTSTAFGGDVSGTYNAIVVADDSHNHSSASGAFTVGGDLIPATDNTGNVGTAANTWSNGQFTNMTIDNTLNVRVYIDLADSDGIRFGSSDDSRFWYNGTTNKFIVEMEATCVGYQWTDNQVERMYLDKASGNLTVTGGIYMPIIYDSNNTGYYVDPASTSNFNVTATNDEYTNGWFRNNVSGNGLYNQAVGAYWYADGATYWNLVTGAGGGIRFRDTHNGTIRGFVYAENNNNIGFLNNAGAWKARVVGGDYFLVEGSSSRAPIFYDSNNTSYYSDPASTSRTNVILTNNYHIIAGASYRLKFWGGDEGYAIGMSAQGDATYGGRVGGETTSDYNMYFTMAGGTNRGFVFRSANSSANTIAGIDASGNGRFEGDVVAYSASDKRLKENITPISNALDKVSKMGGYEFDWNDKQTVWEDGKHDVGVIAQEVLECVPEAIKERKDGYLGVRYEKLIPVLIQAIKEQQTQIEELQNLLKEK